MVPWQTQDIQYSVFQMRQMMSLIGEDKLLATGPVSGIPASRHKRQRALGTTLESALWTAAMAGSAGLKTLVKWTWPLCGRIQFVCVVTQ